MKVVYHPRYEEVYTSDPAAEPGRMEAIREEISEIFEVVTPEPASPNDLSLVHNERHIKDIQSRGLIYELALLAAGGAIEASRLAMAGEPAFGAIRPPGHHASTDHCWGFCFFNNVAIAVERLRRESAIENVVILDIDLHYGDGTVNIFRGVSEVVYLRPDDRSREAYIESVARLLDTVQADIIAVSAGFDLHEDDWGGLLKTDDYETIGREVARFSDRACRGRRFAVLEGGYNHTVLGGNVRALLEGMS
ncbi:MAG: histone deacetylase family protein [Dehalococcoidia bacterium]